MHPKIDRTPAPGLILQRKAAHVLTAMCKQIGLGSMAERFDAESFAEWERPSDWEVMAMRRGEVIAYVAFRGDVADVTIPHWHGLIRVTAEENSGLIEVAPLFYKDSETPDGFLAQPNKVDLGYIDEDGEPIESIALAWMGQGVIDAQEKLSPDEKLLLSLVSDEPKSPMILRDDFIHAAMQTPVQKGKNKGEKRNNRACAVAYGRTFNKLLEKGLLQQSDFGIVTGENNENQ